MRKDIYNELYKKGQEGINVNEDLKQKIAAQLELESTKEEEKKLVPLWATLKPLFGMTAIALVLVVIVGVDVNQPSSVSFGDRVDDWQFEYIEESESSFGSRSGSVGGGGMLQSFGSASALSDSEVSAPSVMDTSESLGFSVGGAKDVDNFRTNIENGYVPLIDAITYEGLFYEYFFETGDAEECTQLFCPTYAQAVSHDPFSGEEEYYLAVGLNSGMTETDFERKKLNLVIVMDISGSMNSQFNDYYYDAYGNYVEVEEQSSESKMEVANDSIVALLDHLNAEDRLGVVLFDDDAYKAKPMRYVGETDMQALEGHILDIEPRGGTDMSAGMELASEMLEEYADADSEEYENRIIFITDAMPNQGDYSEAGLLGLVEKNAEDAVHTTFIGVGVDFQAELIESITKVRGANYYSVHSAGEFEERMDEGFAYMVTPLVFDLELSLEAEGYDIDVVYGSPEADLATGEILYVNTLFPSKTEEGETRGGLILLKLKKASEDGVMELTASYENRSGESFTNSSEITFEDVPAGSYDHSGIRKGILLTQYVDLMKNWIIDERAAQISDDYVVPSIDEEVGIIAPEVPTGSQWEQTSVPLVVMEAYKDIFEQFLEHLEREMAEIGDDELEKEMDVLNQLLRADDHDSPSLLENFFDDWNF